MKDTTLQSTAPNKYTYDARKTNTNVVMKKDNTRSSSNDEKVSETAKKFAHACKCKGIHIASEVENLINDDVIPQEDFQDLTNFCSTDLSPQIYGDLVRMVGYCRPIADNAQESAKKYISNFLSPYYRNKAIEELDLSSEDVQNLDLNKRSFGQLAEIMGLITDFEQKHSSSPDKNEFKTVITGAHEIIGKLPQFKGTVPKTVIERFKTTLERINPTQDLEKAQNKLQEKKAKLQEVLQSNQQISGTLQLINEKIKQIQTKAKEGITSFNQKIASLEGQKIEIQESIQQCIQQLEQLRKSQSEEGKPTTVDEYLLIKPKNEIDHQMENELTKLKTVLPYLQKKSVKTSDASSIVTFLEDAKKGLNAQANKVLNKTDAKDISAKEAIETLEILKENPNNPINAQLIPLLKGFQVISDISNLLTKKLSLQKEEEMDEFLMDELEEPLPSEQESLDHKKKEVEKTIQDLRTKEGNINHELQAVKDKKSAYLKQAVKHKNTLTTQKIAEIKKSTDPVLIQQEIEEYTKKATALKEVTTQFPTF